MPPQCAPIEHVHQVVWDAWKGLWKDHQFAEIVVLRIQHEAHRLEIYRLDRQAHQALGAVPDPSAFGATGTRSA